MTAKKILLAATLLAGCATPPVPVPRPPSPPRPAVAPASEPAPILGPGESLHVVKKGETLYSIAARHHVPLPTILAANGLEGYETIEVGRRLRVPPAEAAVETPVAPAEASPLPRFEGPIPRDAGWRWPLEGAPAVIRKFSKDFPGIDIRADDGAPVLAARTGAVVFRGDRGFEKLGKVVLLDHGSGTFTLYGHLGAVEAEEGTLVRQGETIGRVGATGAATSPRLHFRILAKSIPTDPLRSLQARSGTP
jgi:murein DD-endopeptidase MepM/ murein hydrolase activator NlpD